MPFLPTTKRDAQLAHEKGHDVLLHLPMQPVKGKSSWLGPGAITTDLSDAEILKRVTEAIDDVPFAVGINNHMGSKATADERVINIILKVCKERGLFFLDSRTTDKSVIGKIAKQLNVPSTENDLFLDDVYTVEHISKQMDKLNKLLKARSTMVAIGHVGPSGKKTAQVIKSSIPTMQRHAQFISISEMLQLRK
ncbi:Divergent polysaccharide deacetylase [compost metagenome]